MSLYDYIRLTNENQRLRDALSWVLENAARYDADEGAFYGQGCGCCSSEITPAEHFKDLVLQTAKIHRAPVKPSAPYIKEMLPQITRRALEILETEIAKNKGNK